MKKYLAIAFFAVLLSASVGIKESFAADTWYVGEGLKEGDYFRYAVCQVDYKSCTEFEMDFWVKDKTEHGDWNLQVVVTDGNKIVAGDMEVGRVAPEPVNVSKELTPYASAYKSSIVWLSGFATRIDPKDFAAPAWGKIGSIGGMQVGPMGIQENIVVQAGSFDTHVIGWHKSTDNKIWVKDNFPFPIKALTFVDVTAGTIPVQYKFELLEHGNTANPPDFLDTVSTPTVTAEQCPRDDSIVRKQANTDTNKMIIEYSYSPEYPKTGCEIKWNLDFAKSFDVNQFESDVHYDVFVIDDDGVPIRSLSQEQGRDHLFSPAGKELFSMEVKEPEGIAHYVIHVYGTGPDGIAPNTEKAGSLTIDIDIAKGKTTTSPVKPPKDTVTKPNPPMEITIDMPEGAGDINNEVFYDPADTYVTPGSTITWTNSDIAAHTVTSGTIEDPDGKFDSGILKPGDKFVTVLDEKGTYPYHCLLHPWMVGSITVDPAAIPEFPVSVIMIMILVIAMTVVISKFRTNTFNLKF